MVSEEKKRITRRKFVGYTATGAVIAAGAAAGVYYATMPPSPGPTPTISPTTTQPPTTTEAAPRELVVGGQYLMKLLDPQRNVTGSDMIVCRHIYDTLVVFRHPNYNTYLPSLATSWEVSEDAKVYTFHLRDDVKFYPSGNPMTADDVVWSFDRALKGQFPMCKAYLYTKEIRKMGDYTVQVELKAPFVAFFALIANLYDGAVLDSKAVIPHVNGEWGTPECDWGTPWLDENSAGTGPYYLKEWSRSVRAVVERNPYYWGSNPANDRITFKIVGEAATLQLLLESGDIDIVHIGMPLDVINEYVANPKPDIRVAQVPIFISCMSHMNPGFKPFSDVKVRQAIRAAVNYPEIVQRLMSNRALPMSSPIYKGLLGGGKTYYEYDLEKAKKLMAESKYPNGFEVTKIVPSSAEIGIQFRDLALKEADDLAKIGIKIKIEEYDWSVMDERIIGVKYDWAQDFQGILFIDPEGILTMNGPPRHGTSVIINKDFPWRDEEIDLYCDQALGETDPAKREELYDKACKLLAERGVNVHYFQQLGMYPYRSNVENFQPWTSIEYTDYSNVTRT